MQKGDLLYLMSNGSTCELGGVTYLLYSGRKVSELPASPTHDYVLNCRDSSIYGRIKLGRPGGYTWEKVPISPGTPFIFHDVGTNSVTLYGINIPKGGQGSQPSFPSYPNNGGVVGPVVNLASSAPPVQSMSDPLAVPLPVSSLPGQVEVVGDIASGANLQLVVLSAGSSLQHEAGETGEVRGTIVHGRAINDSTFIISDNAAYGQGVAVGKSVIHSDQDGGHVGGVAYENSLLHAASPSSMARGTASDSSNIRTGGPPVTSRLPRSTKFTVAQMGAGKLDTNTLQLVTYGADDCSARGTLVQDVSTPLQAPLGFFDSSVVLGSIGIGHAPGVGHGALASGLSMQNANLLATANGSLTVGVAECGEVHMSAGKASFVSGRSNAALAAYSYGQGHNALAYMHAERAQAIPTSVNVSTASNANRIQYDELPTRGFTTAEKYYTEGEPAGFILTTIMVLGDTPDNALLEQPNGPSLDYRRVPFLPFDGTALVEVDLVSSRLVTQERVLPSYAGKYIFSATRVGADNQFNYEILPTGEAGDIHRVIALSAGDTADIVVSAIKFTGAGRGFTVQIVEKVPAYINGNPNSRIRPPPSPKNMANEKTDFVIQGRIWGGHFKFLQVPSGSGEIHYNAKIDIDTFAIANSVPQVTQAAFGSCVPCERDASLSASDSQFGFSLDLPYATASSGFSSTGF